jgi:lipoate-protein ligase A
MSSPLGSAESFESAAPITALLDSPPIRELFGEPAECRLDFFCSPQENMARDWQRTLECLRSPDTPPLLRLYGWKPWAVSLGMYQSAALLNQERCRERGIAIVQRPTGGRALLHAEELTYAVVVRLSSERTPRQIYRLVHERIAQALEGLCGVRLELAPAPPLVERPPAAVCFSSSARMELLASGRKLVGSAQRILGNVLLQHGSILLGDAHVLLAELVDLPDEAAREHLRRQLRERSTSLAQLCARPVSWWECALAVWESFCGVPIPGTH